MTGGRGRQPPSAADRRWQGPYRERSWRTVSRRATTLGDMRREVTAAIATGRPAGRKKFWWGVLDWPPWSQPIPVGTSGAPTFKGILKVG